jgi:hypothetical protein
MNQVWRRDHYVVNQIITGPQCLLLMLDMQPERIDDPFVSAIDVCPVYGKPDDTVVRAAVLKGTDEANAEFGTSWHPLEIRYSYSGYDNRECRLAGRAGYNIVKALAERGLAGIEQVQAKPAKPAEPKVAPDCGGTR